MVLTAVTVFTSASFALWSQGKIYTQQTVSNSVNAKVSGFHNIKRISILNPTTSYNVYDIWCTSGTGYTGKILMHSVTVEPYENEDIDLSIDAVYDFQVGLSTRCKSGKFDGGLDHPVSVEYK